MKNFLLQFFTWWHGQTLSVRLFTWLRGEFVGEDSEGNRYFRGRHDRRWVVYNGEVDASRIPSGWHGWMHYRVDSPPSSSDKSYKWEEPHESNMTGTSGAYRPSGVKQVRKGSKLSGDYEAWTG